MSLCLSQTAVAIVAGLQCVYVCCFGSYSNCFNGFMRSTSNLTLCTGVSHDFHLGFCPFPWPSFLLAVSRSKFMSNVPPVELSLRVCCWQGPTGCLLSLCLCCQTAFVLCSGLLSPFGSSLSLSFCHVCATDHPNCFAAVLADSDSTSLGITLHSRRH